MSARHFGASAPVIVATQALNGLGVNAHQSWALRRADVVALAASPFRLPRGGALSMAHVRMLPESVQGVSRLSFLLDRVVRGWGAWLRGRVSPGRLIASLALPERFHEQASHPRFSKEREQLRAAAQALLSEVGFHPVLALHGYGHAAGAYGLSWAAEQVAAGGADIAFAIGLDSYYDGDVVDGLLEEGRAFDGRTARGMVPGEGCALVAIASAAFAGQHGLHALATLEAVGVGEEPVHSRMGPSTGQGLASAVCGVTSSLAETELPIEWWLGDLTNEDYRQKELQLALARFDPRSSSASSIVEQLPMHLGDLGAATIGTGLCIATEGFSRGDPAAGSCLVWACSEGSARGAVLVRSPRVRG